MAQNKVMKLWTAIVTAFLALCTALGLITTTAAAAVPQTETTRNCAAPKTLPAAPPRARSHDRALPPTMKQRIRAEAHGSSPSCRKLPTTDASTVTATATLDAPRPKTDPADQAEAEPATPPLQR
ncbi:hypothetical protein SGFS_060050 [Streptomyces graminofaciens]|uniref:Secreted protein n=1 Tax=Streptomyces graminofaciens TaxID=68212 RepID=A0ABM7FEW4_9ACTN|nr:DUF6344 domain-containing protein [Streptomyces graminofaciens]BBC34711.1 hypothetical protein SGFS_060050 [Streptomyces graminofaciens]